MIARRPANCGLRAVGLAHEAEKIVGAAQLERPRALQALGLDEQASAQPGVDAGVLQQRRAQGDALEAPGGGLDIGKSRQRRHQETPSRAGRCERSRIWLLSVPGKLSSGAPARFTHTVGKPKYAAPRASQQFDERKQTLSRFTPQRASTRRYTLGSGLKTFAASTPITASKRSASFDAATIGSSISGLPLDRMASRTPE